MLDVCDAGILLGRRYAEHAKAMARRTDGPNDRARLERMGETCRRVPEHPATTFFEAVQSLWFAHILTCGEDGINANSIGRLDQILYPYYRDDIDAGRLTRDEALEIMEEYACKMYLDYDVQAITLGGVDAHGHDAVNELSHVVLDATENVEFVRDLSVRLHSGSPPSFVRRACDLIVRGGGIPFLFNDDCFVKALADRGIALADARDYAPIGCIELTIPGKALPHAVSGWFNALKCLELALFGGRDPGSGEPWGPDTGMLGDHADFGSFYAAYRAQAECMARRMVQCCSHGEMAQRKGGPLPCWSLLTDDCIERGRDITDGGCLYNYHSICFMGAPNVADSLMALKTLVFEKQVIDPADLLSALKRDFEGREPLRRELLQGVPKYGNDAKEVDGLAARVCSDFIDLMDTMQSALGARFFVHLFTWRLNIEFGKGVGATPDGRRAHEPLAYSISAHQGRDEKGVTAMLRSLSRLPHDRAGGASAAIIDVDPKFVSGEAGAALLQQLVTSALSMGVGQLQWNVVSVERLRQAQEDPEHYGNIAVRVAGYSQMFKLIHRELQEHIIARTKHKA
jgi:formate C-acetyltransferase